MSSERKLFNDVIPSLQNQIAIIWNIEDVQEVRPDLTDEQALEVLLMAKDKHDAEIGINWDVLRIWADKLFPERTENATAAVMVFVSDGYARDAQFYCGTPTDNGCIHDDEENWRDFRNSLLLETVRGTDDIDAAIRITADKYECSPDVLWGQIVF